MKILLLGGTGTLSKAVLFEALKHNYTITILNRGTHNDNIPSDVRCVKGDFFDTTTWKDKICSEKFDVVVDFLSRKASDIERTYPVFMDICKQYIFISSACVYRRAKKDFPIKETSCKPNKDWSYNIEKYECELMLRKLAEKASSYFTIIRPYITYNDERIPLGIAPAYKYHKTLIERIKSGKPWFVWDDGNAVSTVTYADDFAVGVVGLFLNEKAKGEDFHITGDFSYTQNEIVEMLFSKLKKPLNVIRISTEELYSILPEYKEMLIGDRALDAKFDNSKIKSAVPNLKFNTSLSEGLDKVLAHFEKCTPLYDYQFEARIDRLIDKCGTKVSFVRYYNSNRDAKAIYFLFRYLPIKIALRLRRWI